MECMEQFYVYGIIYLRWRVTWAGLYAVRLLSIDKQVSQDLVVYDCREL